MRLYTNLVHAAGLCGIVVGVALMADAHANIFFIPALVFSLIIPIGAAIGLIALGVAANRGSRASFYASWILAAVLAVPVSIAVYVLILARRPMSLLESLPQMGAAEKIGLAALAACLPGLAAIVVVGFQVRARLRRESRRIPSLGLESESAS